MKRKNARRNGILALVVLLAAAISAFSFWVQGVWNEEEAVHITPSEIEDSTLAIGTHLIHLSALTEEIYEIAMDSADESGQNTVYYKSELSGGTWFDITSASSLEDITTGGSPVLDSEIEALFFTHHTRSDGITYDLRTNEPVNIYDINDPYDIETFDELLPLKNQYEIIRELQSDSAAGREKIEKIETVLNTEVENDETALCDEQLDALQRYYNVLSENNASSDRLEAVQGVMNAVDATRRANVFTTLESVMNTFTQELPRIEDSEEAAGSSPDTELQSAANDSLSNVQTSLIEYQGKMMDAGTTVMSNLQYEYSQSLIEHAQADNHAACDTDVDALLNLSNIASSVVADSASELSLLNDTVVPRATQAYLEALGAGVSADYVSAAASNASRALLQTLADTNTSEINTARNELESYISAVILRVSNAEGTTYLNDRLEQAQTYYDEIPEDDFSEGASGTVDSHIEFLTQKLRELELAAGGNELDALIAEKADLQTQYLSALDGNDLTSAAALEDQIAVLDDQIAAMEATQADELNAAQQKLSALQDQLDNAETGSAEAADLERQIAAAQAELTSLEASLSDGSIGSLTAELKAECLSIIGSTSASDPERSVLSNDIDTLSSMLDQNVKVVMPALQDIHAAMVEERDLNGDSSYDDAIASVEEAILGSSAAYNASLQGSLSEEDLQAVIDGYFEGSDSLLDAQTGSAGDAGGTGNAGSAGGVSGSGGDGTSVQAPDPTTLSEDEQAVVSLLALQQYFDETQSEAAGRMLSVQSQQQINLGNPLLFSQADDPSMEYVTVQAAANAANLRYVWNRNKSQATLAQGSAYYTFAAYSDLVRRGRTESEFEQMTNAARLQGETLYLPESYTVEQFGVEAVYFSGTSYAAVQRDDLTAAADELAALMLSA